MKSIEEYLGQEVEIIIDRPLGSKHPKYDYYYSVNYGFIPNTISGDNEEIDAYILGENVPLQKYKGIVIGIIKRLNDNEDKLVVSSKSKRFTKEQIKVMTNFQEQYFESKIICLENHE